MQNPLASFLAYRRHLHYTQQNHCGVSFPVSSCTWLLKAHYALPTLNLHPYTETLNLELNVGCSHIILFREVKWIRVTPLALMNLARKCLESLHPDGPQALAILS